MKFSILFPVHNPSKKAHPQHEILGQRNAKNQTQKDTNFGNAMFLGHFGPEKRQKSDPERHEFREHHDSSAPWARELPKIKPRRHEFWERHNSLLPWARESPNPTKKDTNFGKLHSLTPAKMPTK